jgi:PBP1b-binding outer membrane lipoprotein LpoB
MDAEHSIPMWDEDPTSSEKEIPMKKILALVLAMAFVVAACSSSTEDSVETYCDDLGTLQTSLQSLAALDATATIDQVNEAKDAVKSAYDATVASAQDVDDAVLSDLEDAQGTWQDSIDAIPGDATVDQALQALQAADATYLTSVNSTMEKVSCSS